MYLIGCFALCTTQERLDMDFESIDKEQLLNVIRNDHQSGLNWLENLELNSIEDEVMRASVEQNIKSLQTRLDLSIAAAVFLASLVTVCEEPSSDDFSSVCNSVPEQAVEIGLGLINAAFQNKFSDFDDEYDIG